MFYQILLPNINGTRLPRPPTVTAPSTARTNFDSDNEDDFDDETDFDEDEYEYEDMDTDEDHSIIDLSRNPNFNLNHYRNSRDLERERNSNNQMIEFYENRITNLERQVAQNSRYEANYRNLEREMDRKSNELLSARRDIDNRNLRIEALLKENLGQKKDIETLNFNLKSATEELESFKHYKMSSEVVRLAKHISIMQKEAYFKNLLNDLSISRSELVMKIVAFDQMNAENEAEKNELLKENRKIRIDKENFEKKMRLLEQQLRQLQLQPKQKPVYDDGDETELENELENNKENVPINNPFAMKPSTSSKMVPSTIPKGLTLSKGSSNSVSTGTGKRQKVLELNGQSFVI